ncbi:maltose ABC transporter substrate-binding protein [Occultella glacieicola]|uniref:Maltose ABC transporter substrate-binding protein n=1 Tax=Occultella glacieicola TaxID=2518684 RepID=A0ABY2DZ73_9MICO|nr:maltose ABC transporter substrate-binding protein [Occultella glacieicola]TDE89988.1 maltose ABC transporter substrate-binding protein [Occultella glacieicola]
MRRSIVITAAVGLTMALAACGGGSGSGDEETTGAEETTEAGESAGTLTIWADEFRAAALTDIVAQFEEDKGVTVEIVEKNFDDIRPEFITQAPTGEGPDIIVGAHDWAGELVTDGLVSPVELGDVAADFAEVAVSAFTYEGSVYGVPYGIENVALVRNNALASDTPATFDELIAQGEATGAEYPVLIQMGEEGDAFHMYPLQTSFGAPVFATDESGSYIPELALGGAEGTAFAEYLASIGQAGSGVLDTAITGDIAREAFANGESPYIITGPWNIAPFTDAGVDLTVLPIPSAGGQPAAPFVGVQGFYVSAHSENGILANEFLVNYAATEDVQVAMYETGGRIPALTAAAEAVGDDPVAAGFTAAGEIGVPMPSLPQMNSVWAFWGVTEANLVSGVATDPAADWATMVENIQGAIDAA